MPSELNSRSELRPQFQAGYASRVAFVGRSQSSLLLYIMRCQSDQLVQNAWSEWTWKLSLLVPCGGQPGHALSLQLLARVMFHSH